MKRKILSTVIITAVSAGAVVPTFAAETSDKTKVTMQIGNPIMTINGTESEIDDDGTVPVIRDERTLLPVRAFVEGIGGEAEWNDDTKTATLTYGDDEISLTVDSETAYLNGTETTLDTAPVIINDHTMLPIRFIAESFGYTVIWDNETQTVTVIDADKIENVFPRGDVNPYGDSFTGESYLQWLTSDSGIDIPSLGQVTFEPCTRTDWHSHGGGQILLCTEGVGVIGMEGQEPRIMQRGDVVFIAPNQLHYHAAIDDSWFSHISVSVNPGMGTSQWLDPVGDDEYNAAVATARANGTIREKSTPMFPLGEVFTAEGYTGQIYKNVLVEHEDVYNCTEIDNYTFEPGARTAWHSHESGQAILVTDGTGIYQEEGQEARMIKAGDVIIAKPGVNHWHGAADELFAYISINANPDADAITWGDDVSDEDVNTILGTAAAASAAPTASAADTADDGKKTLVAYYSATGTTKSVADALAEYTDADLFEIVPAEPYTSEDLDWNDSSSRVVREHDNSDLRSVELTLNTPENWPDYDTVYIGYPIWWGIAAWPASSFVAANDFTGKTVIPFCTSASSGLGDSGKLLEETAGTGTWLEGMRFGSGVTEDDIAQWVDTMSE